MVIAAVIVTMADRIEELGHIAPSRLRASPAPGTATINDLAATNSNGSPLCELIDQTLVEKATGYEASVVAAMILRLLGNFVTPRRLGLVSGADGMFQLLDNTVRAPDVAFVSRERLPEGRVPSEAFPSLAPDLAVEVLSPGNTKAEMSRKRIQYFLSGTRLVWMVDCANRSVAVYTSPILNEEETIDGTQGVKPDAGAYLRVLNEEDTIDGGDVLPGFTHAVSEFFTDLDLGTT